MIDSVSKLTEGLYMNNRMSLEFFMFLPDAIYTNKDRDSVRFLHTPVIRLLCKETETMKDFYDFKNASFTITVNNHYDVIEFFNTIMRWLYHKDFNDLFMMNGRNEIEFNPDFKSLHTNVSFYGYKKTQVLSAVPAVVVFDSKRFEGVQLYVNHTNYMIPLTFTEVGIIFNILKEFNFSAEVTKLLSMFDYVKKTDRIHPSRSETKTPFD